MPPAIESRVSKLEDSVRDGLKEIKDLIVREIQDLKNDQLKDIKGTIDRVERDLKGDHARLADDQRRLWDRVNALELRENQGIGAGKVRGSIWHIFSMMVGALITAIGTWLARKG